MRVEVKKRMRLAAVLLAAIVISSLTLYYALAVPQGATLLNPSVDSGPTKSPDSRTDAGGRIITVNLALEQQDSAWKAYVGNVSGTFVLQNSNNRSIYEWPAIAIATGEVYISRSSTVNFSSLSCASPANITAEDVFLGFASTDTDNINNTFNVSAHRPFTAGTTPFLLNACRSIATWVNDTQQTPGQNAVFQEVLLSDNEDIIYASLMNDNMRGFDNVSLFDFQAIIAENRTSTVGTAYYFYVELGS